MRGTQGPSPVTHLLSEVTGAPGVWESRADGAVSGRREPRAGTWKSSQPGAGDGRHRRQELPAHTPRARNHTLHNRPHARFLHVPLQAEPALNAATLLKLVCSSVSQDTPSEGCDISQQVAGNPRAHVRAPCCDRASDSDPRDGFAQPPKRERTVSGQVAGREKRAPSALWGTGLVRSSPVPRLFRNPTPTHGTRGLCHLKTRQEGRCHCPVPSL